jgi:hypothetical protein
LAKYPQNVPEQGEGGGCLSHCFRVLHKMSSQYLTNEILRFWRVVHINMVISHRESYISGNAIGVLASGQLITYFIFLF